MYKVLIVDDETLDREGLLDQINWSDFQVGVVDTARNGFEALDKIKMTPPDILITDVKMPGMNGIQLAGKARNLVPALKILFVSGYDDFDFVRNAFKLDAYEYILKPVETEELAASMKSIVSEIEEERQQEEAQRALVNKANAGLPLLRRKFLLDLIYGTAEKENIHGKEELLELSFGCLGHLVLLAEIDDYRVLQNSVDETVLASQLNTVEAAIMGMLKDNDYYVSLDSSDKPRFVVLFNLDSPYHDDDLLQCVKDMGQRLIDCVQAACNISLTIAVGNLAARTEEICESYNQACAIISQKILAGKGTVMTDYRPPAQAEADHHMYEVEEEILRCITCYDVPKVYHLLDHIFDAIARRGIYDSNYIRNYCINLISRLEIALYEQNERMEEIFGPGVDLWSKLMNFETIVDIRQWIKNIFRTVIEYLENKQGTKNRKIVALVLEYIGARYAEDITLKEAAAELFYSANYLGSVFKEEVGQGFSEYLAEYRIERAKELLKDPTLKTYQIAERVGYRNIRSFLKQFKASVGITPKVYKERC